MVITNMYNKAHFFILSIQKIGEHSKYDYFKVYDYESGTLKPCFHYPS